MGGRDHGSGRPAVRAGHRGRDGGDLPRRTEPGPRAAAPGAAGAGCEHRPALPDRASSERLDSAAIRHHDLEGLLADSGAKFVYVLDPERPEGRSWDNVGRVEDVATGSAAGPAVGYLLHHGVRPAGEPVLVHQGRFSGRPSTIEVRPGPGGRLVGRGPGGTSPSRTLPRSSDLTIAGSTRQDRLLPISRPISGALAAACPAAAGRRPATPLAPPAQRSLRQPQLSPRAMDCGLRPDHYLQTRRLGSPVAT